MIPLVAFLFLSFFRQRNQNESKDLALKVAIWWFQELQAEPIDSLQNCEGSHLI